MGFESTNSLLYNSPGSGRKISKRLLHKKSHWRHYGGLRAPAVVANAAAARASRRRPQRGRDPWHLRAPSLTRSGVAANAAAVRASRAPRRSAAAAASARGRGRARAGGGITVPPG